MSNPSKKVLVIRKPDASIHVVALVNKASLMLYNKNLKPSDKWTFEEMDEDKAAKLPYIDPHYVSAANASKKVGELESKLSDKDQEIADLKKQLAEAAKGNGTGGNASTSSPKKVYAENVATVVAKIKKAKDVDAVNALTKDDERAGVLQAAEKQIATFK